jgi:hypothetical protein
VSNPVSYNIIEGDILKYLLCGCFISKVFTKTAICLPNLEYTDCRKKANKQKWKS